MQNTPHNARKGLISFFVVSMIFSQNIDKAHANILDTTLSKIKKILNIESKINTAYGAEVIGEEPVLKARYDNANNGSSSAQNKNDSNYVQNITEGVLISEVGPMRTSLDAELVDNDNIQVYEVKEGDSLASIAKIYGVSKNTISWANDIKNGKTKIGDILIILPVSGVKHTVKKGDTLKGLAKKYDANISEIGDFNNIRTGDSLTIGDDIIIPDGKVYFDSPTPKKMETKNKGKIYASAGAGYYTRPIIGGVKTQNIHGHNGVDIGAPVGTPLLAAANGTVLVAKGSGYNGGYGKMVIISHSNGTQTVYGHMNSVYVTNGQNVSAGEVIGEVGNTGRSTGPHLHFEIRGATNPF